MLKKAGHAASDSRLGQLRTADLDVTLAPSADELSIPGFFRDGLILHVPGYDGDSSSEGLFEVILERDPERLAEPSMHLLKAWKLDAKDQRTEELYVELLPEASWFEKFLRKNYKPIRTVFSVIIVISLVRMVRALLERFVFKSKDKEEDAPEAEPQPERKKSSGRLKGAARKRAKRDD
eukprot:scaffold260_cov274-Pinguiococcus_pyrenoidosus.AAC.13